MLLKCGFVRSRPTALQPSAHGPVALSPLDGHVVHFLACAPWVCVRLTKQKSKQCRHWAAYHGL